MAAEDKMMLDADVDVDPDAAVDDEVEDVDGFAGTQQAVSAESVAMEVDEDEAADDANHTKDTKASQDAEDPDAARDDEAGEADEDDEDDEEEDGSAGSKEAEEAADQPPKPEHAVMGGVMYSLAPLRSLQVKANSTSSIYIDSTIYDPNIGELVSSVSTMIHCQISRDFQRINSTPALLRIIPYFAESAYTGRPRLEIPDVREVYGFLKHIFEVGRFSPECCVVSLIYMNRLIGVTGVPLTVDNWKPIAITALVVAQKVWDDTPLLNADFAVLYPTLNVRVINTLERKFLDLLQFRLGVAPSLYAQYYFELRSICEESNLALRPPLDKVHEHREKNRVHAGEQYQESKALYRSRNTTPEDLLWAISRHHV